MEILELVAGLMELAECVEGLCVLARGAWKLSARLAGWLLG